MTQSRGAPGRLAPSSEQGNIFCMKLTAVFVPDPQGGYTCFVKENPAAISQGETIDEARAHLLDALKLVIECQREIDE